MTHAMTGERGFVSTSDLRLSFVAWGPVEAPAVLLLHGLRAYAHWFDDFAAAAGDRFRLIALDQRGRGLSDWASDGRYDTDAYVADLEGLAADLDLERFALVGHSMGGTNAVAYGARHPARLSALILVDSAPELDPAGLARIAREVAATPPSFASRDDARHFLRTLHVRASETSMETRLDCMLAPAPDGGLRWRIDPAIFNPKLKRDGPERGWAALARIACPTLMVRGALTDLVTLDCAERMTRVLPDGRRVEIPDAAHMVLEDNPAAFNAVATAFLDRVLLGHKVST